jgi:hypothetical protein
MNDEQARERADDQSRSDQTAKRLTPITPIRAKCLDCCCGSEAEVRRCPATSCSLHPYRMGKRPKTAGSRTPAQREADRKNGERLRAAVRMRRRHQPRSVQPQMPGRGVRDPPHHGQVGDRADEAEQEDGESAALHVVASG